MIEFISNHPILSILWVGCIVGIIITHIQDKMLGVKEISNQLVAYVTDSQGGVIIDIRPLNEFKSGHIVNSHHIAPQDVQKKNFGLLENYKNKPIILVNKNGLNIIDYCKIFKEAGFNTIFVLKDGIDGWAGSNLTLVKKK